MTNWADCDPGVQYMCRKESKKPVKILNATKLSKTDMDKYFNTQMNAGDFI